MCGIISLSFMSKINREMRGNQVFPWHFYLTNRATFFNGNGQIVLRRVTAVSVHISAIRVHISEQIWIKTCQNINQNMWNYWKCVPSGENPSGTYALVWT